MATTHEATATWQGDLLTGRGTVSLRSGAMREATATWKERTEGTGGEGATSPEELLAAAHASCFSMALASGMAKVGAPPTRLEVSARVTFGPLPSGGSGVAASALSVRAAAPRLSGEKLRELAEDAKENCPLSQALRGNVALSVESELA